MSKIDAHPLGDTLTSLERMTRLELVSAGWKPEMLPLHHIRILGLETGFEPAISCLQDTCSTY
jgi:hypothetical protein